MRLTIMGAGALGSYFGARLQAAGHDVTYVARGAHLDAMRVRGLRIESGAGDLRLPEVRAVATPAEAPEADAILFLVKNYDVETAAEAIRPTLGPETFVVTGQNGVSAPERLAVILGEERVVPGVVMMPADIKEPGVVRHPTDSHTLALGETSGVVSARVEGFAAAIRDAGIDVEVETHIEARLWQKFIVMATLSSITALTRLDVGPLRDVPGTRRLMEAAIDEAAAVGLAECPTLPGDVAARTREIIFERLPPHMHASMLDDLNRGKRIELPYLGFEIGVFGRKHGIPTPTHDFMAEALMPFINGTPG